MFERFKYFHNTFADSISKLELPGNPPDYRGTSLAGKEVAWKTLFGNMTLEEIVPYINIIWIDQRYQILIRKDQLILIRVAATR